MARFSLSAMCRAPVRVVNALAVLAAVALMGPQALAQERMRQEVVVKQVASDLYFLFDFNGSNSVFLVTDARKYMAQLEMKAPASSYAKVKVMGKEFDPSQPEKYLASFAVRKKDA